MKSFTFCCIILAKGNGGVFLDEKTKNKLEKLESERMMLEFKDYWDQKDLETAKELDKKIEELKKRA